MREEWEDDLVDDDDEATLAATSDVVARIRAQAAGLSGAVNGEVEPTEAEDVPVWTADELGDDPTTGAPAQDAQDLLAPQPEAVTRRATSKAAVPRDSALSGDSLIADRAPPATSATYWDGSALAAASVGAKPDGQAGRRRLPGWMVLVGALIVLVVVLAAIIVALTAGGW